MIIGKVISGGQTGADIAGLRAAVHVGIDTGGTAPRGFRTENGDYATLGKLYGLKEHSSREYPPRTIKNIMDSDCTLVIGDIKEAGSRLTISMCFQKKKPVFNVTFGDFGVREPILEVAQWVSARYTGKPLVINIAGNRESKYPGTELKTKIFLIELFRMLNAS